MSFKVLIIDDDTSFQKIVSLRLKSFLPDMALTHFENLTSAREYLKSLPSVYFDLVVMDEHLPDGRGAEFIAEGWFRELAVLSVSSDPAPDIPGHALSSGATFFLAKVQVSEPLFRPLVEGVIARNRLQSELLTAKIAQTKMDTVKTLLDTLRHEINNPLGAVLGAAYLIKQQKDEKVQKEAIEVLESSGNRIKHVIEELCKAVDLEIVTKAEHAVFQVPGDKPWK